MFSFAIMPNEYASGRPQLSGVAYVVGRMLYGLVYQTVGRKNDDGADRAAEELFVGHRTRWG